MDTGMQRINNRFWRQGLYRGQRYSYRPVLGGTEYIWDDRLYATHMALRIAIDKWLARCSTWPTAPSSSETAATNADIEALADEAEAGYDVSQVSKPRVAIDPEIFAKLSSLAGRLGMTPEDVANNMLRATVRRWS